MPKIYVSISTGLSYARIPCGNSYSGRLGITPLYILLTPILLIKGKCFLKRRLSEKFGKFIKNLPFNSDVISYIQKRKKSGSKIWLVTACDEQLAKSIAEKTGLFDGIYGSSESINLKGEKKADFCESTFGVGNFDYIGDSLADLPVWEKSSTPVIVGSKNFTEKFPEPLRTGQK